MQVEKKCKIIEKKMLTPYAVSFELAVGDMVKQSSGEFVHIRCGEGLLLRRPISVCTSATHPDGDRIRIVFEARGEGTAWLMARQEGESLDVLGLLGNEYAIEKKGRYLLVGGGIGIPPLLGVAERCYLTHGQKPTVILGFRSKDREMLLEEFSQSCQNILIATDDGSSGYHGFVDAVLQEELSKDSNYVGILACGPSLMLKNTVAVAEKYKISCQVSMEERMGCGVGACLVCACDKKDGTRAHVCKDGPVFRGEEIDFGG
ncbi:MAG: dihydroorotate dehydrogenase electron transfer subunit [Eubacteriales bacterium]